MKYRILFIIVFMLCNNGYAQIKTLKEYYPSGKLKAVLHEGNFNGCNMKVGTDSMYDEKSRLVTTIQYDNIKDEKDNGCHATLTVELTRHYYNDGKIRSFSQQKYAYEAEACDCGEWIRYDNKGKIIEKIVKTDCYNKKPCNQ